MSLVGEDPLASDNVGATGMRDKFSCPIVHQGPVLVLHSHMPVGVGKRNMDRGWDQGRSRWRRRGGGEYQAIWKYLEACLGPSDHALRIHRRRHRDDRSVGLRSLPPRPGGLWRHHVSRGSESRLSAREGSS
jgi:hypothetical protein